MPELKRFQNLKSSLVPDRHSLKTHPHNFLFVPVRTHRQRPLEIQGRIETFYYLSIYGIKFNKLNHLGPQIYLKINLQEGLSSLASSDEKHISILFILYTYKLSVPVHTRSTVLELTVKSNHLVCALYILLSPTEITFQSHEYAIALMRLKNLY